MVFAALEAAGTKVKRRDLGDLPAIETKLLLTPCQRTNRLTVNH